MSELVLCYSYTGNSRQLAEVFAREKNLELCTVKTQRRLSKFAAFVPGCLKALKGASMPIEALGADLGAVKTVQVFAPIWAGQIAPPMNAALALLPKGTKVSLHLVSGSGDSSQEKITQRLRNMGLELAGYEDIRK